jgi:3'-5' exoribonuclease
LENKGCYINTLPAAGEVTFLAVVTEKELRPKRNGGVYLHLRVADRTGELDAKVWERPEETAWTIDRDQVVKVRGTVEQYNERPQLVVTRIRQCGPEEYSAEDFCPTSEQDPAAMYGQLLSYVEIIQRPALQDLLRSIVGDPGTRAKLMVTPAALKIHHAIRSGLLEHIVSMCELSVLVAGKYPRLDLDWLLAGAVLHDLGKTETLEIKGLRFDYTERGRLLEHITLGLELLDRFAAVQRAFPPDLKTVLQHLIVSHHGDLDKGALRLPMMPEAIALNLIDLLDARMDQVFRCVDQAPDTDAFTTYVPSLARQLFRKSTIGQQDHVEGTTQCAGGMAT